MSPYDDWFFFWRWLCLLRVFMFSFNGFTTLPFWGLAVFNSISPFPFYFNFFSSSELLSPSLLESPPLASSSVENCFFSICALERVLLITSLYLFSKGERRPKKRAFHLLVSSPKFIISKPSKGLEAPCPLWSFFSCEIWASIRSSYW